MAVVERYVLDSLSRDINDVIRELDTAIVNYIDASEKIDSVINVLKEHYNSEGGEIFTNKIAKINFSGDSLNSVVSSAKAVNYEYEVKKGIPC